MKIKNTIDQAAEKYSDLIALRALVCGIPWIGGSLDALIGGKGQRRIQARIKALIEELKTEFDLLAEAKVDKSYVESEEFSDLMIQAFDATAKTRQHEKIRLYARFLAGTVVLPDRQPSEPEEYLRVLSELTERELDVARGLYRQQKDFLGRSGNPLQLAKESDFSDLPNQCPSIPLEDFPFIFGRLEKTGLVRQCVGTYWDYTGGVYEITPTFRKLMRYLEVVESTSAAQ